MAEVAAGSTAGASAASTAAASGAASTGTGSEGNANLLDYGTTSDDQILSDAGDGEGLEDDLSGDSDLADGDTGETDAAGEEGQEGEESEELEEEEEEEGTAEKKDDDQTEDETPDPADDPQDLRQAFKTHPQLREAYYREQAYRQEFPTVAEARQYKEALPTVEDLQSAVESRTQLQAFDDLFFSSDPKDHAAFLGELAKQDAQAFASMAAQLPAMLYQTDPQAYRDQIATPLVQTVLSNLMNTAMGKGNENLKNAVDVIAFNLFGKRFAELGRQAEPTAREKQLEAQNRQYQQENQQRQTQQFEGFRNSVNETAVTKITGTIKQQIMQLAKGTALENRPKAQERIIGEIYNKVDAAIKADRALTATLRKEITQGKRDREQVTRIANLLIARGSRLIPRFAKEVVTTWKTDLLGESQQRANSTRTAAARRDITGGAGTGAPGGGGRNNAGQFTPRQVDYSRTSDDDILSDRIQPRKK
jgi:hypothetical protein